MAKILITIFVFIFCYFTNAQNLVSNPSFEIYSPVNDTSLINSYLKFDSPTSLFTPYQNLRYDFFGRYCLDWFGTIGTLRNKCWDSLGFFRAINQNISKYEEFSDTLMLTHSGMSSVNLLIHSYDNYYEISSKLIDTLSLGCKYKISFYVYVTNGSNIIYNNIGILFNLPRDKWNDEFPDQEAISGYFLKNTTKLKKGEWQKIDFEYVARGDEYWFTIGKYNSVDKVKPLKSKQKEYAMLIYIDDISITEIQSEQPNIQN